MEIYKTWYQGVQYPVAEITIFEGTDEEETVMISSVKLSNRLLDDIQANVIEASLKDEYFAAYIQEEEFNLSEEEVTKIVEGFY